MNPSDIEQQLLLESSGELSPEQLRELEAALTAHPAYADTRREFRTLQQAGRLATDAAVPPQSDTAREAILRRAEASRPRRGPGRLLAAAALVLIGLALWPHLPRPGAQPPPLPVASHDLPPDLDTDALLEEDPLLEDLNTLNRQLRELAAPSSAEPLETGDADYWALQLLAMEDSR